MKYIISRMLLLINSVIITVQLDDNDYNNNVNTLETTEYKEHDIPLLSEYLKSTTTYQEYSISTNIFMFISLLVYSIIIFCKLYISYKIIADNDDDSNLKKLIEVIFQALIYIVLVLIVLLIVPIIYNNIILNIICSFLFTILFTYFLWSFCLIKQLVKFTDICLLLFKIISKNFEDIEAKPFHFENISITLMLEHMLGFWVGAWIVLSIITRIIPRTITYWNEKEIVIKDIKNWISTSNIMRYILRNINNKFNIFSLPIASTNITLFESIFSLLLSCILSVFMYFGYMKTKYERELKKLQNEYDTKVLTLVSEENDNLIGGIESILQTFCEPAQKILIELKKYNDDYCFFFFNTDIFSSYNNTFSNNYQMNIFYKSNPLNSEDNKYICMHSFSFIHDNSIMIYLEKKYPILYKDGTIKKDGNEKYKYIINEKKVQISQREFELLKKLKIINLLIIYIENHKKTNISSNKNIKKLVNEGQKILIKYNSSSEFRIQDWINIIYHDKGLVNNTAFKKEQRVNKIEDDNFVVENCWKEGELDIIHVYIVDKDNNILNDKEESYYFVLEETYVLIEKGKLVGLLKLAPEEIKKIQQILKEKAIQKKADKYTQTTELVDKKV